jgi:type I restriction enzyme S subunit
MNLTSSKNWKAVKLGEIADVKGGKRLPLGSDLVSYKTKHPYIRVTDIQDGKIKKEQLLFVTDEIFKSISRYIVDANDVVLSIVGSVGFVAYIDKDLHKASLTENCVRVTEYKDGIYSKFLFYYLISRPGQHDIQSKIVGSTQPKLPIYNIRDLEIPTPPISEQKEIADMLGSLDDKIELLRKENKTLENIAQTLFKEWFVDFNFPGTTGKMIDSEFGEIPEGWRVGPLSETFEFLEGPGIRNWQYRDSGFPFINIRLIKNGDIDIKSSSFISKEEANIKYKHFQLKERDMVVSTSGTLGRSAIVRKEHLPLLLNTSVIRFRPKEVVGYPFMYQYLNSSQFLGHIDSMASGSAQLNFGPMHLNQINVVLPNDSLFKIFNQTCEPIYKKIINNMSEIQNLSNLRNELLNNIFTN